MRFFRFLFSKIFILNVFILIVAVSILLASGLIFLKKFTHHGESLTLPDFTGYSIEEVSQICKEKDLRYEVYDSVYVPDVPFFSVVEQDPKALSKVKRNRKTYLIISSDNPPKVKLPNLIDVPLDNAIRKLKSYGLKVGDLEYEPDIALNAVLKVKKDGRILPVGALISKGSKVDLILGDGGTSGKTHVPRLIGLSLDEVYFALPASKLNIGAIIPDETITDTLEAIIYKQYPVASSVKIPMGESVDIWITHADNFKKMNIESSTFNEQDSSILKMQ
ncbi:MAG: PASTA domain-containing protein [Bacteroidetes bacterium]|nr:PASTA domain-containing protein [Bacteroidota bacterium]